MKKQIAIATVIATIAIAGITQANAGWGQRGAGNFANCPCVTGQYGQIDAATQEKLDAFYNDTQELRKEIAMKRAEKQALMRSDNPDPAALSTVTGELFDLQATMRQKAEEAGIDQYVGPRRGGFGRGMWNDDTFGPGMRGKGRPGQGMRGQGGGYMSNNMQGPGYRGSRF